MTGIKYGSDGLAPCIVQDSQTSAVLMLGWTDPEAWAATLATGLVHFHSRSRNALWRKGKTSGHTLTLVDWSLDCDGDAVLIKAQPQGPTCHMDSYSCFTPQKPQGFADLEALWELITQRATERPGGSYTTSLLSAGVEGAGRKVVEEATELLLAAKDAAVGGDPKRIAEEAADLVFHMLVLLAERGVEPRSVVEVLHNRRG